MLGREYDLPIPYTTLIRRVGMEFYFESSLHYIHPLVVFYDISGQEGSELYAYSVTTRIFIFFFIVQNNVSWVNLRLTEFHYVHDLINVHYLT